MRSDAQFLNLLFWSGIFDLFAVLTAGYQGTFARVLAFIVLVLKVPIGVTCTNLLRDRGGQYSLGGMIPGRAGGQGSTSMSPLLLLPCARCTASLGLVDGHSGLAPADMTLTM